MLANNRTVSVISAVMNRDERVIPAVENWKKIEGVDEIILLDWSSKNPIGEIDGVKVVRVDGEERWILTSAFNLAAEHASGDIMLKLDIDYRLEPDFLNRTKMKDTQFRHGSWRIVFEPNDLHLAGFLMVKREDFWKVGGYNEKIVVYGHDDSELYNRLAASGLEKVPITPLNGIKHIPHDYKSRHINQGGNYNPVPPPKFTGERILWYKNKDGNFERSRN